MSTQEFDAVQVDDSDQDEAEEIRTGGVKPREISPADALAMLHRGETIRDAKIVRLRLQGEFALAVKMERVELVQASFQKAVFQDEVVFGKCKLIKFTSGKGATFAKGFDVRGSTIINSLFTNLKVHGPFRCDLIRTFGKFSIAGCRFEGTVRFWEARFGGWVQFKQCTFVGEADFRSYHGEEGFSLEICRFEADALFRGATSMKKWDAGASHFERLLDLSKVKFHDFAYLEAITVGEKHTIAFHNAVADRILVRTDQVEGRLASEKSGDHAKAMQEYGLLKRIFEGLHRYEQEDWAFYRFKVNQRRSRNRSWRKPWTKLGQAADYLFLDVGCGYGTNPLRAVLASAVIMLIFGVIYMLDVTALPVEKKPFDLPITHPLNRLMIGLLTSVSVFTSGFGSLRDAAMGWMNIPLIAESLLGTLLWGLFIVAFSRKVIR